MSSDAPPLGRLRGLAQCASAEGTFTVVALDHRQSLRKLLGPDAPGSVTIEQMVAFKRAVARALSPVADAMLIDPEVGLAAMLDGSLAGRTGLMLAVEATGYDGPATARANEVLPGWSVEQAKRLGASAVKLLVHYHPEARTADRQERLVERVWRECQRLDIPLFLEPLTYSIEAAEPELTGEARRRAVVGTARRLGAVGMDVLKAQFPYGPDVADEAAWADACAELSEAAPVPWVLLSAGVDDATFRRQATVACRGGASGVLAGRSLWWEAAGMTGARREAFLATTSRERLGELRRLCATLATPWPERSPLAGRWAVSSAAGETPDGAVGERLVEGCFARYRGFR